MLFKMLLIPIGRRYLNLYLWKNCSVIFDLKLPEIFKNHRKNAIKMLFDVSILFSINSWSRIVSLAWYSDFYLSHTYSIKAWSSIHYIIKKYIATYVCVVWRNFRAFVTKLKLVHTLRVESESYRGGSVAA